MTKNFNKFIKFNFNSRNKEEFNMKAAKILTLALTLCTILAVPVFAQSKSGWTTEKDGLHRYLPDGVPQTGWNEVECNWYYFDSTGKMLTGWVKYSDKWYYLNADGTMTQDKRIGNYYVNIQGEWVPNA